MSSIMTMIIIIIIPIMKSWIFIRISIRILIIKWVSHGDNDGKSPDDPIAKFSRK